MLKIVQVDAFTDRPFAGNPAAVCVVDSYPEGEQMQSLAREINLSETAFLKPVEAEFELRWFTPAVEVDLCGHATLASAHFLWTEGLVAGDREIRFHTRSGLLRADWRPPWVELDFPSQPAAETEPVADLLQALAADPVFVGRNRSDWLVELASEEEVRNLQPDLTMLADLCPRGLIVTSRGGAGSYDFVSRFFAPAVGVDEDPVTGSAHCCLAPYWAERLGKTRLTGYQASARGGLVRVRHLGDRVVLGGQAVTVMEALLVVSWPSSS